MNAICLEVMGSGILVFLCCPRGERGEGKTYME